jgi:vacuolar-type H+-ATPase subunit H
MTKIGRFVVAALVLGALVAGLSGCKKKEGPAEKAGKEIDKAVDKTGQEINKAVEKTGEKIEQAGEKIQDSVKDVKK